MVDAHRFIASFSFFLFPLFSALLPQRQGDGDADGDMLGRRRSAGSHGRQWGTGRPNYLQPRPKIVSGHCVVAKRFSLGPQFGLL